MEPSHDNLYSKTQLRKMGLIPTGEPVKRVKGEWGWFNLYRPDETKSVRKASVAQLAVLEKARGIKVQKEKERREAERLREIAEWEAWEAERSALPRLFAHIGRSKTHSTGFSVLLSVRMTIVLVWAMPRPTLLSCVTLRLAR
jgi:hypothetical protein